MRPEMLFLILVGIISFVFGILFLFSPHGIRNLSDKANRAIVHIDEKIHSIRIGIGISLILISVLAFFVVYFLSKKYG